MQLNQANDFQTAMQMQQEKSFQTVLKLKQVNCFQTALVLKQVYSLEALLHLMQSVKQIQVSSSILAGKLFVYLFSKYYRCGLIFKQLKPQIENTVAGGKLN